MIAALPMYDWPEVRSETDALWSALRDGLRGVGVAAPAALTRPDDPWPVWRDPALTLSQTCGLPFAARLRGEVSLLGAPAYDLPDCAPGRYRSALVVRAEDETAEIADLVGKRFAFNMRESQSGWVCVAARIGDPTVMFDETVETGAHRASVVAVAEGRADCAAIDGVAWRMATRHEPAAAGLRVLAWTDPTPGLPFITAPRDEASLAAMRLAIETEIEALAPAIRDALFLTGFAKMREADYAPLAAGWPR